MTHELPEGYAITPLPADDFRPLFRAHRHKVFDGGIVFHAAAAIPEAERRLIDDRAGHYAARFTVNLALYHSKELVGWSWGIEETPEKLYMVNSFVDPAHRRKGLYTALMGEVLTLAQAAGFQVIYSRHAATNNAVIIPKLKAGFLVSGFELSDTFGLLLHLSYFADPLRRRVMAFRSGDLRPDETMRPYLTL